MTDQRTPEWYAARKGRLTASMAGAALGLAPYMSEDDAMRALVRDMHSMENEFKGNIATDYGIANEPLARSAYELETGNSVRDAGFVAFEEWAGASPDGYIGDDGLIEIKCPYGLRKDPAPVFKPISDQPHYYAQVQLQLFVTGKSWCHFWQWSPHGSKLETVKYDDGWINENLPRLKEFWWKARTSNAADYEGERRVIVDTPEAARLVAEYDDLKEAIENAEVRKKEIIAKMVELANGKNALVAGRNLTLVKRAGAISYAKAVAELLPDVDLEKWRGKPSESWQVK